MTQGTILITGLNGYLAGRTAEACLKEGFRVRGTVRNLADGSKVKAALCDLGYRREDVEVIHVPDMTKPGVFDEPAAGCSAILHLAYPIGDIFTILTEEVVRVVDIGLKSAAALLDAATKAGPQLRTVVYMSSTGAVINTPAADKTHTESDWNTTSETLLQNDKNGFNAYCASKTMAERFFWKFREERKPSFAMTAFQPTYFIGPPLVPWETPEQIPFSVVPIWQVISGQRCNGMMLYQDTIDIRDIARLSVWAATHPKGVDGERFICSSAVGGPDAMADILSRRMPSLDIKPASPEEPARDYKPKPGVVGFDQSKAVRASGLDWTPFETSVVDTAALLTRYLQ
ncbi:hypothetical protein F4780DRAFT_603642 [Xylariomycetidae sp. FL0641]|nr:hypothetical protein F4780DRAFT_603642 [Xylariomycetidae sp. FL0641]